MFVCLFVCYLANVFYPLCFDRAAMRHTGMHSQLQQLQQLTVTGKNLPAPSLSQGVIAYCLHLLASVEFLVFNSIWNSSRCPHIWYFSSDIA